MSAPIDWDEDGPDADPATATWRDALGLSTSARLRAVEAERDVALRRHAAVSALAEGHLRERDRAREQSGQLGKNLAAAIVQNVVLGLENKRLREENDRLTARVARQRGHYELTEKGLAAIEPTVHQLVSGDDHVRCCGRTVAEVDAAHERTTFNPHAVTCHPEEHP